MDDLLTDREEIWNSFTAPRADHYDVSFFVDWDELRRLSSSVPVKAAMSDEYEMDEDMMLQKKQSEKDKQREELKREAWEQGQSLANDFHQAIDDAKGSMIETVKKVVPALKRISASMANTSVQKGLAENGLLAGLNSLLQTGGGQVPLPVFRELVLDVADRLAIDSLQDVTVEQSGLLGRFNEILMNKSVPRSQKKTAKKLLESWSALLYEIDDDDEGPVIVRQPLTFQTTQMASWKMVDAPGMRKHEKRARTQ